MSKIVILLSVVLFFSCSSSSNKTIKTDSLKPLAVIKDTSAKSDLSTEEFEEEKISGTFTVDNVNFRYAVDSDYMCNIEKQHGNNWIKVLSYEYSHRTDSMYYDVNNDGFPDVINHFKWFTDAYLYNPETKSYDTIHFAGLENEWMLLDTGKNVFCSNREIKATQIASFLYTFDKLIYTPLYSVEFETKKRDDDDDEVGDIILSYCLYKGDSDKKETRKLIRKVNVPKDFVFDYEKFWKENYKELMTQ